MKRVLFVCIENSNRSQMAEAFAKIYGNGKVEAYSAGSKASGKVNPRAIEFMAELGYDLSTHRSEHIDNIPAGEWEYVISMGCGDDCPFVPAKVREDWQIPDPKNRSAEEFRIIRDFIGIKVRELIDKLS